MVHGWSKSAYFNYTHEKKTPCMYNIVQSAVIPAPLPTSVWHHCDLPLFWCPLLIICYLLMPCCSSFVIFWCPLVIISYLFMPCCYHQFSSCSKPTVCTQYCQYEYPRNNWSEYCKGIRKFASLKVWKRDWDHIFHVGFCPISLYLPHKWINQDRANKIKQNVKMERS